MFSKILPRNNDWNRKYNFSDENGFGFLMDLKLGQAFFGWQFKDTEAKFYKCEQEVFEKNFSIENETVEYEFDPFDSVHFLRYPIEM